jgi:hypothetical protein
MATDFGPMTKARLRFASIFSIMASLWLASNEALEDPACIYTDSPHISHSARR